MLIRHKKFYWKKYWKINAYHFIMEKLDTDAKVSITF